MCVHGIGEQKYGATATSVFESIRLGAESIGGQFTEQPLEDAPTQTVLRGKLSIGNSPPLFVDVYDAWWDSIEQPPRSRTMLTWLWKIAPFAILYTALLRMIDHVEEVDDPETSSDGIRFGVLLRFFGSLPILTFALILLPLLPIVVFPLTVFGLVVGPTRAFTSRVLTAVLGDAWLYIGDKADLRIVPHIQTVMQVASQDHQGGFAVLGHSQGAELARRAVAGIAAKPTVAIWVGSGEGPLTILRILTRSRFLMPLIWLGAVAYPALSLLLINATALSIWATVQALSSSVSVLVRDISLGHIPTDWDPSALSVCLFSGFPEMLGFMLYVAVFTVVGRGIIRRPEDILKHPESVVSIRSPLDPVAFGHLNASESQRSVPVDYAGGRWILEHVTYFKKKETGSHIIQALLNPSQAVLRPRIAVSGPMQVLTAAFGLVCFFGLIYALGAVELSVLGRLFWP